MRNSVIRLLLKNNKLYIGNFHTESPSNNSKGMKKAITYKSKENREEKKEVIRDFSKHLKARKQMGR